MKTSMLSSLLALLLLTVVLVGCDDDDDEGWSDAQVAQLAETVLIEVVQKPLYGVVGDAIAETQGLDTWEVTDPAPPCEDISISATGTVDLGFSSTISYDQCVVTEPDMTVDGTVTFAGLVTLDFADDDRDGRLENPVRVTGSYTIFREGIDQFSGSYTMSIQGLDRVFEFDY